MPHPFEYRAHINPWGDVCHCPWGYNGGRTGSHKEAAKIDKLRKEMVKPDQLAFLRYIEGKGTVPVDPYDEANEETKEIGPDDWAGPKYAQADKLLPWLAREWKKGRLELPEGNNPGRAMSYYHEDPDEPGVWTAKYKNGQDVTLRGVDEKAAKATIETQLQNHPYLEGLDQLKKGTQRLLQPRDAIEMDESLDEMKKRGKGVDMMQHPINDLLPKIDEFKHWKEIQERDPGLGEVVHKFPDNWTIRQLQSDYPNEWPELEDEGELMGHCVGDEEQGSPQRAESGKTMIYSLRDQDNMPHATLEMTADGEPGRLGPGSMRQQFYGKSDAAPLPDYEKRVNEWLKEHGTHAAPGGQPPHEEEEEPEEEREAAWAQVNPATSVNEYNEIHGNGEYYPYVRETDEDLPIGEYTEIEHEEPDWDQITEDFLSGQPAPREGEEPQGAIRPGYDERARLSPENQGQEVLPTGDEPRRFYGPDQRQREEFYKNLGYSGHEDEFNRELGWHRDSINEELANDPENVDLNQAHLIAEWDRYQEAPPSPPQQYGQRGWRPYAPGAERLFQPNTEYKTPGAEHPGIPPRVEYEYNPDGTVKLDENGKAIPKPLPYGPAPDPWQYTEGLGTFGSKTAGVHPFEWRAHYREDGEICHCPWGLKRDPEHLGSVREAAGGKQKWLEDRPDFQEPGEGEEPHKDHTRNKFWLTWMKENMGDREHEEVDPEGYVPHPRNFPPTDEEMAQPPKEPSYTLEHIDKLLPWMHREFKKGRLIPGTGAYGQPSLHYKVTGDPYDTGPQGDAIALPNPDPNKNPPQEAFGGTPAIANRFGSDDARLNREDFEKMQKSLEEMQNKGKGVDMMQHKVHELMPKVKDFQDWKKEQERQDMGEVLHQFGNGWTMRRLQNADEHYDEGEEMGHCIGGAGYAEGTERGDKIYASLRDHKNFPHASLEVEPDHWKNRHTGETTNERPGTAENAKEWIPQVGPSSYVGEFYGKEDREPEPEYHDMVNEWLEPHGVSAEGGRGAAPVLGVGPAEDLRGYNAIHGDEGDYGEYADDEDEEGRDWGENTEYDFREPDWRRVAEDTLDGQRQYGAGYQNQNPHYVPHDPQEIKNTFATAMQNRHMPMLEEELYNYANPEDPTHQKVLDQWEQLKEPYYHPYTGAFVEDLNNPPIEEFKQPFFTEVPEYQRRIAPVPYNLLGDDEGEHARPIGPERSQWNYTPEPEEPPTPPNPLWQGRGTFTGINPGTTASASTNPFYYRWVFSPNKGVTLGTNADNHPAMVKYHQGLGGDINDTDLSHGYAYPIGNGWRLTDYDHKPVEDPFIVNQVVRRLNHQNDPEMRSEGSWQPAEYDWDRIHYGLPHEVAGDSQLL